LDNYVACSDRGIKAHIPSLEQTQKGTGRQKDIFSKGVFIYDYAKDVFICPAGQILKNANTEKSVNIMNMRLQRKLATVARLKKTVPAQKPGALSNAMSDKMILI
jgi:hypothetical protein